MIFSEDANYPYLCSHCGTTTIFSKIGDLDWRHSHQPENVPQNYSLKCRSCFVCSEPIIEFTRAFSGENLRAYRGIIYPKTSSREQAPKEIQDIDSELAGDYNDATACEIISKKAAVFFDIQTDFDGGVDPAQNVFQVDDFVFGAFLSLSTKDFQIEGLAIYPNPTKSTWAISTNNQVIKSIEVYNLLGSRVLSLKPNALKANVDATSLTSGVYITKISTELGTITKKLIKD